MEWQTPGKVNLARPEGCDDIADKVRPGVNRRTHLFPADGLAAVAWLYNRRTAREWLAI
jgi:hypothetical protein